MILRRGQLIICRSAAKINCNTLARFETKAIVDLCVSMILIRR
jgi:hypothetical protein